MSHVKDVFVSRDGTSLSLSPSLIELHPGESIRWHFPNPSLQELMFIHFDSPDHPFGPFQSLEPSSFHVLGNGNSGRVGDSHYTAMILDEHGCLAKSDGSAKVVNHSSEMNTSPEASAHYDGEEFLVDPHQLRVESGRTVLWYITGLPSGYFVTFRFEGFEDVMVGPFTSFTMSRGFGDAWLAIGTDFTGPLPGHQVVRYFVSLRRPDGSIVDTDDPVIAPLESPPGG